MKNNSIYKEVHSRLNEADEAQGKEILPKIDWKGLESLLSNKLGGISLRLAPSVNRRNYIKWESQELIEHVGIMKATFKSVVLGSFGSSTIEDVIKENRYWCTVNFAYTMVDMGSNGSTIGTAVYDLNTKKWEFKEARQ